MAVHVNRDWQAMPHRHQALIQQVLVIYCDWLNGKTGESRVGGDPDYQPYEPRTFLDKGYNEFASTVVSFCREDKEHGGCLYMELVPYDGDDGGPATLYIHAERDYHVEKTGRKRTSSYEEYEIVGKRKDGTNRVAREPHTVTFTHDETRLVWDDTYTIHLVTQEFDTYWTTIHNPSEETDAD